MAAGALGRGHRNRATSAVARKLVAYLLAVDRRANATAQVKVAGWEIVPPFPLGCLRP